MTAQNSLDPNSQSKAQASPLSAGRVSKESETAFNTGEITSKEISKEIEIPKAVKAVGVEKIQGTIELPPDLKKLGVTPGPSGIPVVSAVSVTLPLSDDKIINGLKAPIAQSLKWLALWCIFRLQKAHLVLKKIHGIVVRVKSN